MSVKYKQIVLLSFFVILVLAVAVTAVVLPSRPKGAAVEDGGLAPMPQLPNRILESTLHDAAGWPDNVSRAGVNNSQQLRAVGASRYGRLEVRAKPGEMSIRDGGASKYKGTYTVTYYDTKGNPHELPNQVSQVLRQLPVLVKMKVLQLDNVDVLLFQPRYYRFAQGNEHLYTTYAYAITSDEEAFPLQFVYNENGSGLKQTDSFLFDVNGAVEPDGAALYAQTEFMGGRYEITWSPYLAKRELRATAVRDRAEEYAKLDEITGRASKYIEQALGLEEVDYPNGKLSEAELGEMFTNRAWSNPGNRFLREEFAKQGEAGNKSRAFAWLPIDAAYTSADTIRFTFTINLWYAIGLAGHLEVELKQRDGEWIIADLGTFETEKFDDPNAPYSGLLMEDPLE